MFKRLETDQQKRVTIFIDDVPYAASASETVAAAVLANGIRQTRTTAISNSARAPFCLMGVCYECLMKINGLANQRACKVYVVDGMHIETQLASGVAAE